MLGPIEVQRGLNAPQTPMTVLITSFGTAGDLHPFLSIAKELRRRGHEPLFLTNPFYRDKVVAAGAEHIPIGTLEDHNAFAHHPDNFHWRKGPLVGFREVVLRNMPRLLQEASQILRETGDKPRVGVCPHFTYGFASVLKAAGVPTVKGAFSPSNWLSQEDPGVLPGIPFAPLPPLLAPAVHFFGRRIMRRSIDEDVNKLRMQSGLPSRTDNFREESVGAESSHIGLWSPILRGKRSDDPGPITGYCWSDPKEDLPPLPSAVTSFLAGGEAPVVFTLGSGAVHYFPGFYEIAARACEIAGLRGLLLTGKDDNAALNRRSPATVFAYPHLPHAQILPLGQFTVPHGGAGTTGENLRAGKPAIVVPFVHDQFDNAWRLEQLNVGTWLSLETLTPERLARALLAMRENLTMQRRARYIQTQIENENGSHNAVDAIERIAREKAPLT